MKMNPADAGIWQNYAVNISLGAGTGNVVPTFSTQDASYCKIGNTACVNWAFGNTSGGTAGAGTGVIQIDLPEPAAAGVSSLQIGACGAITSAGASYIAFVNIEPNATVATINFIAGTTAFMLTGADFANPVRYLQTQFFYPTA